MADRTRVHVTDDLRLLAAWRGQTGEPDAETVVLRDADGRRRLRDLDRGAHVTAVLASLSPRASRELARPGVRRAARVRLVALRGLARRVALDEALAALEPQLAPTDARPVEVAGLPGVAVTLTRAKAGAERLPALAVIASQTASWDAAEASAGPRVAVAGSAWEWADGLAAAAPVDPLWATDAAALRGAGPDVVVVGPGVPPDGAVAGAVHAASADGAVVVSAGADAGWETAAGLAPPGPLDPGAVPSLAAGPDGRGPGPLRWAALDEREPPAGQARELLLEAAHGHPVVAPALPSEVAALVGDPLAELLTAADPDVLDDDTLRERHGVRLRRAALSAHSLDARWRAAGAELGLPVRPPPAVSVVLATRRPSFLDHALDQIAGQTHRPLELVVALHGVEAPPEWVQRARQRLDGAVTLVEAPANTPFGQVLQAASTTASGEVLTKMDDDDFYGPEHVTDLLLARRSTAATLIGKGGEFYYDATADCTIRRLNDAREQAGTLIAGNTLTIDRADLQAVGGWQAVDGGEDRRLVHDVLRAGGQVHRTHGFGHVVHRHERGHTWATSLEELRGLAVWEAAGCRLDVADAVAPAG